MLDVVPLGVVQCNDWFRNRYVPRRRYDGTFVDGDEMRRRKNRRPFNDILEFPDIAGPVILRQPRECLVIEDDISALELHAAELKKVLRQ